MQTITATSVRAVCCGRARNQGCCFCVRQRADAPRRRLLPALPLPRRVRAPLRLLRRARLRARCRAW
jgi:hypothetical protein